MLTMNITRSLLPLIFLAVLSSSAHAKEAHELIEQCWSEGPHAVMAACVIRNANAAKAHLAEVESSVRQSVHSSTEKKEYVVAAKKAFEAGVLAYRAYRRTECGFRESLSSTGNAWDSVKIACQAELDEQRAKILQADNDWLN
jgi:uncharacterized protein YecT (DUF1311 family)